MRHTARWLILPTGVILLFLVLVSLNLSGSSIALLSPDHDAGVVAGQPRSIRSDEWQLQTPISVSSVRQDFPSAPWIGLARIDQAAAAHGGPTRDWSEIFKPQDWGYLLLGPGLGLAFSWWTPYAVCVLGSFALLGLLTRRPLVSAALALVLTFTPYNGWWSAPAPGLFIGLGAAVAACTIAAWNARRRTAAWIWAIIGGLLAAAFAVALYPPWQISLGWVVAAACVGYAIDRGVSCRRLWWPVAVELGIGLLVLGVWYLQHEDAIRTQARTFYPGHRVAHSGGGALWMLLSGPLNFWMTGTTGSTLHDPSGGPAGNLSEAASSWLPLPLAALVLCGAITLLWRRRRAASRAARHSSDRERACNTPAGAGATPGFPTRISSAWTLILLSAALAMLLAWSLTPVPSLLGKLTMLDRVEAPRLPLAMGLAATLLIGVAAAHGGRQPLPWRWHCLLLSVVVSAPLTLWAAHRLPWHSSAVSSVGALASGALMAAAFAALLLKRARPLAAAVLVAYSFISWLAINPLQHGLTPIDNDHLVKRLQAVAVGSGNPRVAVFASDRRSFSLVAKVRASGLQSLTGTTLYPDPTLMESLAPGQRSLWNNYAQYIWTEAPVGTPPRIEQVSGTLMRLVVPVCDPVILSRARPGWVVADHRLSASCVTQVSTVSDAGHPLRIYRVTP